MRRRSFAASWMHAAPADRGVLGRAHGGRGLAISGTATAPPPTTSAQHAPTATFCTLASPPPPTSCATNAPRAPAREPPQPRGRRAQAALVDAAVRAAPEVPARDLARPHARRGGLVERIADGVAGGLARRRGAPQVLARPGEQRAGGLDGGASRPGDLLVREPFDRAHDQDGALALRQPVDVAEQRAGLGAAGELVRKQRGDRRARRRARRPRPAGSARGAARRHTRCGRAAAARGAARTAPRRRARRRGRGERRPAERPRDRARMRTAAAPLGGAARDGGALYTTARDSSSPAAKRARSARSSGVIVGDERSGVGGAASCGRRRRAPSYVSPLLCSLHSIVIEIPAFERERARGGLRACPAGDPRARPAHRQARVRPRLRDRDDRRRAQAAPGRRGRRRSSSSPTTRARRRRGSTSVLTADAETAEPDGASTS